MPTATTAPARLTRPPVAVAAGLGAACVGLALWNPGDDATPLCPTRAVFGVDCPLCGGLRSVAALGRLDPARAADHNLFVVAAVPVVVAWWLAWWWADRRGEPPPRWRVPRAAWIGLGVVAALYTVLRNLGRGGAWDWLAADAA